MNTNDIPTAVRKLIATHSSRSIDDISDEVTLGSDGLGLDSIAIAELLLECQRRMGLDATPLLDGEAITVGRLIGYLTSQAQP